MPTIYEQLGQEIGIGRAVEAFYSNVVTDVQLAHYFANTDIGKLRQHTTALLVTMTGGPSNYAGRNLGEAHAHLGISAEDFMRVVGHFVNVLESARLGSASIDAVIGALAAHKADIVTADATDRGARRECSR
jgi:hemoglobin